MTEPLKSLTAAQSASVGEIRRLLQHADQIFLTGDRAAALDIYEQAESAGVVHPLGVARRAERVIDVGEAQAALLMLQPIEKQLGPWERCIVLRAKAEGGHFDEAVDGFVELCKSKSDVAFFRLRFFDVILMSKNCQQRHANAYFALLKNAAPDELAPAEFKWRVVSDRIAGAVATLKRHPEVLDTAERWVLVAFSYKATQPDALDARNLALAALGRRFPKEIDAVSCAVDIAFERYDLESARRLMAEAEKLPQYTTSQSLIVKSLLLACLDGKKDAAEKAFLALGSIGSLPESMITPVYSYLAESNRWKLIAEDFEGRLRRDMDLSNVEHTVMRAARKSNSVHSLLSAIAKIPNWDKSQSLVRYFSLLSEDYLFCSTQSRPPEAADVIIGDVAKLFTRVRVERLRMHRSAQTSMRAAASRNAIFFCTNRSYLCGSAVTLYSLLLNNPDLTGQDYFVVIESDDEVLASDVFSTIGERFGVDINLVVDEVVVSKSTELKQEYGLFTGGHNLARAAYYRIYTATWLQSLGQYDRGVYVDSDVIIGGGFENLLTHDFNGKCLMARLEVDKPEVRMAIEKLKLNPGKYFNSGVLVLDFTNPETAGCLAASIDASERRSKELVFQDQCALNIGFKGNFSELEPCYNYFLAPSAAHDVTLMDLLTNPIVHFLDRPKPWDALYEAPVGLQWLQYWRQLAKLLGKDLAQELFAAAAR